MGNALGGLIVLILLAPLYVAGRILLEGFRCIIQVGGRRQCPCYRLLPRDTLRCFVRGKGICIRLPWLLGHCRFYHRTHRSALRGKKIFGKILLKMPK